MKKKLSVLLNNLINNEIEIDVIRYAIINLKKDKEKYQIKQKFCLKEKIKFYEKNLKFFQEMKIAMPNQVYEEQHSLFTEPHSESDWLDTSIPIAKTNLTLSKNDNIKQKYEQLLQIIEKEKWLESIISSEIKNYINLMTNITFRKNEILRENDILADKKVGKFKNFMIKIFTFGCYDKNQVINHKLNINKTKNEQLETYEKNIEKEMVIIMNEKKKIGDKITELHRSLKNLQAKQQNFSNLEADIWYDAVSY